MNARTRRSGLTARTTEPQTPQVPGADPRGRIPHIFSVSTARARSVRLARSRQQGPELADSAAVSCSKPSGRFFSSLPSSFYIKLRRSVPVTVREDPRAVEKPGHVQQITKHQNTGFQQLRKASCYCDPGSIGPWTRPPVGLPECLQPPESRPARTAAPKAPEGPRRNSARRNSRGGLLTRGIRVCGHVCMYTHAEMCAQSALCVHMNTRVSVFCTNAHTHVSIWARTCVRTAAVYTHVCM